MALLDGTLLLRRKDVKGSLDQPKLTGLTAVNLWFNIIVLQLGW
jgi:hypothetical protein